MATATQPLSHSSTVNELEPKPSISPGPVPASMPTSMPALTLYRMSYDLYERIAELELLRSSDHVVLLDGLLVNQMTKGSHHRNAVLRGLTALKTAIPAGWDVWPEQPIALRDGLHGDSAPEPDLAVVFGNLERYEDRHPIGAEIGLVVEVAADSDALRIDRAGLPRYAHAGIPIACIVNIPDRSIEVHSEPRAGRRPIHIIRRPRLSAPVRLSSERSATPPPARRPSPRSRSRCSSRRNDAPRAFPKIGPSAMIFLELLNELYESRALVDVRRDDLEVSDIRGFILGVSAKLVLIGVVGDDIHHDGYTVIELDEISFLRWGTDYLLGWEKVVGSPKEYGPGQELDLSTWWGAIEAARAGGGLVTFRRERLDSSTCYISDEFRFSDTSIVGRQISTDGQRNGSFALRADDLTRIDFGARYEAGLDRMLKLG